MYSGNSQTAPVSSHSDFDDAVEDALDPQQ